MAADLSQWVGRNESAYDTMSSSVIARLAATLDHEPASPAPKHAPPLSHWLHFLSDARQSELSEDGHPRRGGFMPPVPLPRRMWAGSRISFVRPISLGAKMQRQSTIATIKEKTGASGSLVFVTVRHDISADGEPALSEEQDLVYREDPKPAAEAASPGAPAPDPRPSDFSRTVTPDPTLLMRFSAMTFNAHRIHYDRDYARDVEGYAGLVVQGPLLATLLMDQFLCASPQSIVTRFAFRAQKPLLDTAPFKLCGALREGGADLWTEDASGFVTMSAEVEAS